VTFPAFKAGDAALRGPNGGFDFHTPPPDQSRREVNPRTLWVWFIKGAGFDF